MSFEIDKVYYISLGSREDKHYSQLFAMSQFGVPYESIERFEPMLSTEDLEGFSRTDVVEMIVEDGFRGFGSYLSHLRSLEKSGDDSLDDMPLHHVTNYASIWSRLSLLRKIAESGENALFLTDSVYLSPDRRSFIQSYTDLLRVCSRLSEEEDAEFRCLNLNDRFRTNEPVFGTTRVKGIYRPGLVSCMGGCVLVPLGAAEILDYWVSSVPDRLSFGDSIFLNMYEFGKIDMSGYYFCQYYVASSIWSYLRPGDPEFYPLMKGYPFFYSDKLLDIKRDWVSPKDMLHDSVSL